MLSWRKGLAIEGRDSTSCLTSCLGTGLVVEGSGNIEIRVVIACIVSNEAESVWVHVEPPERSSSVKIDFRLASKRWLM